MIQNDNPGPTSDQDVSIRINFTPLLKAARDAVEYHRRRTDTSYPGYIWVEWDDIERLVDACATEVDEHNG